MPYSVDVFTSWPKFESWDALRTWLTSSEGGLLRIVEPRESPFALVRYVKGKSNFELPHVRWCRSVVVNKELRIPVSVAPPKASELTEESLSQATVAEEFVDGTMLSVFDAGSQSAVCFATRSRLNANTKFYEGGPTFVDMFNQALEAYQIPSAMSILPSESKDNSAFAFTSIVLQHPKNRIVQTVETATFYILHQGHVDANGLVTIEEDSGNFRCVTGMEESAFFQVQPYLLDSIRASRSVQTWVSEKAQKHGFGWQGLVLKDGNGRRWRVRSEIYETVRQIRGNESTMEERFARLRKARSIDQYLVFFPEDREVLYELEGRLRKNTRTLLKFYIDVFRTRSVQFHQLPWPYKHHVSVLHNRFKDTLRAEKKRVDFEEVVRYVNSLNIEDSANMTKNHNLELRNPPAPATSAVSAPVPAPAEVPVSA